MEYIPSQPQGILKEKESQDIKIEDKDKNKVETVENKTNEDKERAHEVISKIDKERDKVRKETTQFNLKENLKKLLIWTALLGLGVSYLILDYPIKLSRKLFEELTKAKGI